VEIHFFYDMPVPNRYAAGIQILHTGAALAARSSRFALHCRGLTRPQTGIFEFYGLPADAGLNIEPFFPAAGLSQGESARCILQKLKPIWARARRATEPVVLMTRGNMAARLLPALERLLSDEAPPRPLVVHELHNLHFLRVAEKRAGRSLAPENVNDAQSRCLRDTERRMLAAADAVIGLTPTVLEAAAAVYGPLPRCLVLPSGAESPAHETAVDRRERRYDLVYAGKIEDRKGVPQLLTVAGLLPGLELGIAGGPESAAAGLRSRCRDLGIAGRVHVAGELPPGRVAGFLRAGAIGACPMASGVDSVSDRFASPLKLLQMMALGLPVVAADVAPVRAIAAHARDAHLVPPNDPDALAAGVRTLLDNPAYREHLASNGRHRARSFTWQERARALESFLMAGSER